MDSFGISVSVKKDKELFKIHRFSVTDAGRHHLLSPESQAQNRNYQIIGEEDEKLVVRIFFNEKKQLHKARYYFLSGMDKELAKWLTLELMERLKMQFKFAKEFELKEIETW